MVTKIIPLILLIHLIISTVAQADDLPRTTHPYRSGHVAPPAPVASPVRHHLRDDYRVRPGDNLERIAHRQRLPIAQLIANNHLHPPYILQPGQYLCLRHCTHLHPAPKQQIPHRYYRVHPGDSVERIAKRLGIKSSLIIRNNNLHPPYTLHPGQRLCIDRRHHCGHNDHQQADTAKESYTVKAGDNLHRIAARYGLSYKDIASWNNIQPPYIIHVGQRLYFHQKTRKQSPAEGSVKQPNRRYRVRKYETLDYLANRFEMPEKRLIELNHLKKPYKLKPGQILCLDNPAPCLSQVHIVVKGETLKLIAQLYDIDINQLVKLNMIEPPYKVFPDQRICLQKTYPCEGAERVNTTLPDDWMPRLDWPLANDHKVLVPFGRRAGRMHDGIDIAAIRGTPVLAAAKGRVIFSGERFSNKDKHESAYGKFIVIEHPNHIFTIYAHNSRNLVYSGKRVEQGDVIAKSGDSGRTHRPVLHFELRKGKTPIDPLPYLPKRETDIIYEHL